MGCLRSVSLACVWWALACGSSGGGGNAAGGGAGGNDCGIASCSEGFDIDATACRCVPAGSSGGAGAGGTVGTGGATSTGGAAGMGGDGGCGTITCLPGYQAAPDGCTCAVITTPPAPVPLPEIGRWQGVSTSNAPSARVGHSVVWTGSEYIVWGGMPVVTNGVPSGGPLADGARYDPARGSWTPMSMVGAPSPRDGHKAAWTGSAMVIFGQSVDVFPTQAMDGYLYDPALDTWTAMSPVGAPTARAYYDVVGVDGNVIVWGGWSQAGVGTTEYPDATGGIYDPTAASWAPVNPAGAPAYDGGHVTLPASGGFVAYGSPAHFTLPASGARIAARYDLTLGTWSTLATLSGDAATSTTHATSAMDGSRLVSVTSSSDGGRCFWLELDVAGGAGSFSTEVVALPSPDATPTCMAASSLPPLVASGQLVETEGTLLVDTSIHTLRAMRKPPMDTLTAGAFPAEYVVTDWSGAVSATDGSDVFVFGGIVRGSEPPTYCPPGAPCRAPAEIEVATGGAIFSP